jgi:Uncharacterised nucleotidyltransferase
MTAPISRLRNLVLAMLATSCSPSAVDFEGLCKEDWELISQMVRQHRIGSMLDYRAAEAREIWPVPLEVRNGWRAARKSAAFHALKLESTLIHIARTLAAAHIEFVILKGGWLAWNAYPDPALRPMRDIDIWVEQDLALSTWDALLAAGFSPLPENSESLDQAMRANKHLPAIRSDRGGIIVEIHLRLTTSDPLQQRPPHEIPEWVGRKAGQIKGQPISSLNPADALLHLIAHSAYDNRLNNGPVIFDDIAFLLKTSEVDWGQFWDRAAARGWTNGCQLLLQLTAFQHGEQPVRWPNDAAASIPPEILAASLILCLQDSRQRGTISMMNEAVQRQSTGSSASFYLRRFYVPRDRLAPLIGVRPGSWMALAAYPLWLAKSGRRVVRGIVSKSIREDAERSATLTRWLM